MCHLTSQIMIIFLLCECGHVCIYVKGEVKANECNYSLLQMSCFFIEPYILIVLNVHVLTMYCTLLPI